MNASFDLAAQQYDTSFTHTGIGRLQREQVYRYLKIYLSADRPKQVLEINCGTGVDAIWLAEQGMEVLATDISQEMIAVAQSKINAANPRFEAMDINLLNEHLAPQSQDLIFSDFGGLNCLAADELRQFFSKAAHVLRPGGSLILVIMPRKTWWERLYFLAKGKFRTAFRRKQPFAIANVDGEPVRTYYYNPKEIKQLAGAIFETKAVRPIGFFVPPSYLENAFRKHPSLLARLGRWDQRLDQRSAYAAYADHFLIHLQLK